MLTAIDGNGQSDRNERSIQLSAVGLIDIGTASKVSMTDPHAFALAIKEMNSTAKKYLYKGLQKEIVTCLKKTSILLAKKNELLKKGNDRGAEEIQTKCREIARRERLVWLQIKMLYDILSPG